MKCMECGMECEPAEYHPFAACLMFKACHNGRLVRGNLQAVRDDAGATLEAQEPMLTIEPEKVLAMVRQAQKELMALRELAGGKCTIQKVVDELGPMSLWSKAGLEEHIAQRIAEALHERDAALVSLLREWQRAYNVMDDSKGDGISVTDFQSLRRRTHAALSTGGAKP